MNPRITLKTEPTMAGETARKYLAVGFRVASYVLAFAAIGVLLWVWSQVGGVSPGIGEIR